jgi:hypothetical protein
VSQKTSEKGLKILLFDDPPAGGEEFGPPAGGLNFFAYFFVSRQKSKWGLGQSPM